MAVRYVVIDDASFIRDLLKGVMTDLGHVCVGEAEDGAGALAVVMRSLPDLVFMDLVMPRKNGVEARREIQDNWPEAKIIACTTLAMDELPSPSDREGFDGYITKPFDREEIASVVHKVMENKKEAAP